MYFPGRRATAIGKSKKRREPNQSMPIRGGTTGIHSKIGANG